MLQSSARQTGMLASRAAATDFIRMSAIARTPLPERRTAATENGEWEMEEGRWQTADGRR
jgi:hypothetical protein